MLQSAGRPYVCWKCLTSRGSSVLPAGTSAPRFASRSQPLTSKRFFKEKTNNNRRKNNAFDLSAQELDKIRKNSDIRERLRGWEAENHVPSLPLLQDLPNQDLLLTNFLTRPDVLPGSTEAFQRDELEKESKSAANRALFDGDRLTDLRSATSALVAGDLVETRTGVGRSPILAICLGRHHGLQYFYMSSGEVVAEHNMITLFTVTGFADPAKFRPLINILPEEPVTQPRNVLFHRKNPEALETAARLQEQLTKFRADSAQFYQAHKQLDVAASLLSDREIPKYMTLEEMADAMLPEYLKVSGKFTPHALYAVHTAVQRDEWVFRPLSLKWHRRNYIYEIRSKQDVRILQKVESQVRELIEASALRDKPAESMSLLSQNSLGTFILKARAVAEANRLRREWTPHGMVGPSDEEASNFKGWSAKDVGYIRFMEMWSCERIVPKPSQLETLGSTILRLTNLYTEAEWLAHWTGFTFLQEIGWIPPYDIPARYEYRFSGATVRRGAPMEMPPVDVNASLRPDLADGHRRDWGDTTIFCVDSEQTADVDDGFSVERTDKPGEYWIHVHIADPASVINPDSDLARQLQKAPSSLYLPGFPNKMLPRDLEQRFSLDPGQPSLTFSAKVDERGQLLDHKIEPGVVRKVIHVPKNEVAAILPGLRRNSPAADTFSVGKPPEPSAPVKQITRAANLPQSDRDDLLLLNRLCKALRHRRAQKGQLPPFRASFVSPEVSLDSVKSTGSLATPNASITWSGDPFIRFTEPAATEADRLVEHLMHTVGEVAAAWCSARRIPVPYSTQPEAMRNSGELAALRASRVDPLAAQGKPLPLELMHTLFTLIGTSELSVDPAPFYSVGLDAYTKASSPLRRFPDLVVHWQIHAALARERAEGSLAGTDCSNADFLPWTRDALAPALPALQALQRQIKQVDNKDGPAQWVTQALLRAWRFGEAPLPKTFTFIVDGLYPFGLRGRLSNFHNVPASIDLVRLTGVAKMADIKVDDLLEVEIADINVVTAHVSLKPLRKLTGAGAKA